MFLFFAMIVHCVTLLKVVKFTCDLIKTNYIYGPQVT
jgi:hypothetical protein